MCACLSVFACVCAMAMAVGGWRVGGVDEIASSQFPGSHLLSNKHTQTSFSSLDPPETDSLAASLSLSSKPVIKRFRVSLSMRPSSVV